MTGKAADRLDSLILQTSVYLEYYRNSCIVLSVISVLSVVQTLPPTEAFRAYNVLAS